MRTVRGTSATFVIVAGLAACGGGSSSSDPAAPATNQSPGGIWTVQYTESQGANSGHTISGKAIVTESGETFFAGTDTTTGCGLVGFGQLVVSGSAVTGSTNDDMVQFSSNPAVNTTCAYADGSTNGTSNVTGTVTQRSSLALSITSATSMGTALGTESHTWSYSKLYAETPSLTKLAANYTDGSNTMTLSSNGTIFEQDPTTGCVINGQISIVNPSYNAYAFNFTFASCTGTEAALNGQTAMGLGYLDDSVTPNQLVFGARLTVNGQTLVLAGTLNKM
jgi:hypothetical protein